MYRALVKQVSGEQHKIVQFKSNGQGSNCKKTYKYALLANNIKQVWR